MSRGCVRSSVAGTATVPRRDHPGQCIFHMFMHTDFDSCASSTDEDHTMHAPTSGTTVSLSFAPCCPALWHHQTKSVVVHTIHLHRTHHICKSRTIFLALGLLLFASCRTWFSFRERKKKLTALKALLKWHAKPASRESVSPFPGADFGMRFIVDHPRRPHYLVIVT